MSMPSHARIRQCRLAEARKRVKRLEAAVLRMLAVWSMVSTVLKRPTVWSVVSGGAQKRSAVSCSAQKRWRGSAVLRMLAVWSMVSTVLKRPTVWSVVSAVLRGFAEKVRGIKQRAEKVAWCPPSSECSLCGPWCPPLWRCSGALSWWRCCGAPSCGEAGYMTVLWRCCEPSMW
jgi:hypothetical protein